MLGTVISAVTGTTVKEICLSKLVSKAINDFFLFLKVWFLYEHISYMSAIF